MRQSTATLSDDGRHLSGTFQNFFTMISISLTQILLGDVSSSLAVPENEVWKSIQGFGQ
ncbi:MAG: hypothetical protein KC592_07575 [Nitrospira sp.]|nr:hypothetical protein [Nitrospira sp.]